MRTLRRLLPGLAAAALATAAALGFASAYYGGKNGAGCARCHEIRPMVDAWAQSTHRGVACSDCHGSSFSAELRMHVKNLGRVWLHARGRTPEQIHIRHQDVVPLVARCARCHAQEHADWASGPHGMSYSAVFTDPEHNGKQLLMDDCLRCHGMHFEGAIRDLVAPLDRRGPWRFLAAEQAAMPAVPCLSCHTVHHEGTPLAQRDTRVRVPGRNQERARPSLAFYDRRTREHVPVARLPLPGMRHGGRAVRASGDPRQALCYQCHAPRAGNEVFSGDDRTPVGVHEGLSCLSCHAKHGQTTRASCSGCHPRLSNCSRDVETMDTSFRSRESSHDVHRVACADCHPRGVPGRRSASRSAPRDAR